jgi:hypothetical protein
MKKKFIKEVENFVHAIHLTPTVFILTNPKSSKNAKKV